MNWRLNSLSLVLVCSVIFAGCSTEDTAGHVVRDLDAFNQAAAKAQPGDVITLANGVWSNVELVLEARGTEEHPITLTAETPGEVILSGQSNLSLSGEYIEVSGLVFRDGFTPTSEVISFRTGKEKLANHCRVTECVIDGFSNPERFDGDTWVAIYGKHNRFDHNSMIGKGNRGVTLAVKMTTEASRDNHHVIEYNYFGPREILGSNGGETLRIGTSHYSREYANAVVQYNYFDRTNGEHEIVSNKACGDQFVGNVFYECQGTLTMRHGHHTLVENNYFLGNSKPNTGGVRIINEYQTVQKNYMNGLTGHRFRGALVIMNGVPNSPINRYNQVVDSKMNNNVVIDSDFIQLCAGSDEERSAIPVGTEFQNNVIMTRGNPEPFTIYDDVSGIAFSGNKLNEEAAIPLDQGFEHVPYQVSENENGLPSPSLAMLDQIGFGEVALPVEKQACGASYYTCDEAAGFGSGEELNVAPGVNTLFDAISNAGAGDVLVLEAGGQYLMTKYALVDKPITLKGRPGERAVVRSEKQSFFRIENGGAMHMQHLTFDGAESPDQAGNNVVSTSKYAMNRNYALVVEDCAVVDLDKNHSFDFLKSYKHTFADSVVFRNTNMTNVTGAVMTMDMEVEDLGIYNVENVCIQSCTFTDVQGAVANIYRGGTDESTFGPIVTLQDVKVVNSGHGKRNRVDGALRFHGVQKLKLQDIELVDSHGIDLFMTNGEPITELTNLTFINSKGLKTNNDSFTASNIIQRNR